MSIPCEADQLGSDRPERVVAPLLRIEAEAREVTLPQRRGLGRVGLAVDVHEPLRPVGELLVERGRIDSERLRRRVRDRPRVDDFARVRVHGRRLLADRELDARAVEDRAAPGGNRQRLALLARAPRRQSARLNRLQPGGAGEHDGEDDGEDGEERADPAIGEPGARTAPTHVSAAA